MFKMLAVMCCCWRKKCCRPFKIYRVKLIWYILYNVLL